jgi:hypothetical protein
MRILRHAVYALFIFIGTTQYAAATPFHLNIDIQDLKEHQVFINGLDLGRNNAGEGTGIASTINIPAVNPPNPIDNWTIIVTNTSQFNWTDFHIRFGQDPRLHQFDENGNPLGDEGPFLFGCIGRGTCFDSVSASTATMTTFNPGQSEATVGDPPAILAPRLGGQFTLNADVVATGGAGSRYFFIVNATVPTPSSVLLIAMGLIGLGGVRLIARKSCS